MLRRQLRGPDEEGSRLNVKEIKRIAEKYTPEEIEGCITSQMERGENVCTPEASHRAIIDDLAKAEFIRELRDQGMSLADALRELARRIRLIQKGGET